MIETRNLTKRYGNLIAANDITLKLEDGDVFGFIGPNGSGKTTTMRMIATLLNPDHGEAYVCGKSIYTDQEEIRRLVGFMPDFFGVYDDMTVVEYLEFFAAAYRIKGPARRKVCEEKLELVDMSFKRDAMVNELSRGQTQRIGLARTLLHDPQVLLLDEPASGLDPRARIEIRNLLKRLGEMKKTIIVSSHILPELADVCTRVGMIEKGHMIVDGNVAEVMRNADAKRVPCHIALSPDVACMGRRRSRIIHMHRSAASGVAVNQNISAGRGAAVVEIMQCNSIGDARGRRFCSVDPGVQQSERHLNPLTFNIRGPVKRLFGRQPFVASEATFDNLQMPIRD